jgi:uncharacterized protein
MRNIMSMFGRSPFIPLQMHMEKVSACIEKIPEILEVYRQEDVDAVDKLSKKISKLEHEADVIKHDIRGSLPRGIFTLVNRSSILKILDIQDTIANKAENFGVLLTFKQAKRFDGFDEALNEFMEKCIATFIGAQLVIDRLDELVETGFGGQEAHSVHELIDRVAVLEHEVDVNQRELIRKLLEYETSISYGDFFLWTRMIKQLSGIADSADELAAAIRLILETN